MAIDNLAKEKFAAKIAMEKYAMEKLEMYVNDKGIFGDGKKWP